MTQTPRAQDELYRSPVETAIDLTQVALALPLLAKPTARGRKEGMTKNERVVWDDMLLALKCVEAFHEYDLNCFYERSETKGRVQLAIEAAEKENASYLLEDANV